MKGRHIDSSNVVIKASGHELSPVNEPTIYPAQFAILLRERMQGKTVGEVAEHLGIKPDDVVRLLNGQWKPSEDIRRRMGLATVYAIASK